MALTLEEMQPFLAKQQAADAQRYKAHLGRQAEVGKVMSELIADPRWELYARHLDNLREQKQRVVDKFTNQLVYGDVVSYETYAQQKKELAKARGYVEAMETAINLVADLIRRGDDAVKDLSNGN